MDENRRIGPVIATVLAALIAAAASTTAAVLTYQVSSRQGKVKTAVDSLTASNQAQQVSIEQQRLEVDLTKRRDDILTSQLPHLLSPDARERLEARVILLALTPNDLGPVVDRFKQALSVATQGPTSEILSFDTLLRGSAVVARQTEWGIVVGAFTHPGRAKRMSGRLDREGFSPITVYERAGRYSPTITGYPSESVADGVLVSVRSDDHPNAFVVDLSQWCPQATPDNVCSPDGP